MTVVAVPHPWFLTPAEAIALQQKLASQILTEDQSGPVPA